MVEDNLNRNLEIKWRRLLLHLAGTLYCGATYSFGVHLGAPTLTALGVILYVLGRDEEITSTKRVGMINMLLSLVVLATDILGRSLGS